MEMPIPVSPSFSPGCAHILWTRDEHDLRRIVEDDVQAVICVVAPLPDWVVPLTLAVESGRLSIPRTVLPNHTRDEVEAWFAEFLPDGPVAPDVRDSLVDDILELTDRLAASAGVSRFRLRIFTEAPTEDCGFHVDTVAPGAPPWGLLRVYNGAGTSFVEPDNLGSAGDFHRYLDRRERLERDRRTALEAARTDDFERVAREIAELDAARSFLARPEEVFEAPAGSIVAFKHVDLRFQWTQDAGPMPWVHCSPMRGGRRLVVNVTSPEPMRRPHR